MEFQVLECKRFILLTKGKSKERIVADYEFDFYIKGYRTIFLDETKVDINKNDISFRKSRQTVSSYGAYNCYILNFDFSGTKTCNNYSRIETSDIQPLTNGSIVSSLPSAITPFSVNELTTLFALLSEQIDINSDYSKNIADYCSYNNTSFLFCNIKRCTILHL